MKRVFLVMWAAMGAQTLAAQTGENVLLVINQNDPVSRDIGDYYRPRRGVPDRNVCSIAMTSAEEIDWGTYERQIERPVGECLKKANLTEKVLYIALTLGVPLRVAGPGNGAVTETCSVDSELTLLYARLKGVKTERAGWASNPYFMKRDELFAHPRFPIYLVTRLAAFDVVEAKQMIDRSLAARNRGRFVLDLNSGGDEEGNNWLRTASLLLPTDRVILDATKDVLYGQRDVIGYASWGSNDKARKQRDLGFQWLPGAIATEFVSTNGRTFKRPPDTWTYTNWSDRLHLWEGSPQGLTTDLVHQGATGASGNVFEPYLSACVRPDYLFPAYYHGHNLAESYYVAMPYLSWQGIVLGDPLCSIRKQ